MYNTVFDSININYLISYGKILNRLYSLLILYVHKLLNKYSIEINITIYSNYTTITVVEHITNGLKML